MPEASAEKHLAQVGGTAGLNGLMVHNVHRVGSIRYHAASLDITLDVRTGESSVFLHRSCLCVLGFCCWLAVRRFFFGLFILLLVIGERTGNCAHSDQKG